MPIFKVDNDNYDIPESEVQGFLNQFPNAKPDEESLEKTNGSQAEDATAEPVNTASSSEDSFLELSLQKPKKQEYYEGTRFEKTPSSLGYIEARKPAKKPAEEPAFIIDAPEVEVKPSRYDVTHDDTQLQFILDNSSDNDATKSLTQYLKDYYKDQDVKFKDLGTNRSLLGLAQVRRGKMQVERNDGSSYTFTVPTSKGNQFNFIKDIRGFLESDASEYELSNDDANTLKDALTKVVDKNYLLSDSSAEKEVEKTVKNFFNTKGYEGQFDKYEVEQSAAFRDRVKIKNSNGVSREFKLKDPKSVDQIIHFIQSNPQNRKDKENYKNQSANLNGYLDQFFTNDNIDRVLGENLNLRTLEDNEMEPEEFLLEVVEEDLGGFGFFDNIRRSRDYPDMSNEDIISTVRERMQAEIQNYKSRRTESLAADFVANFKGDALKETNFLKQYRENKVSSYAGLEGELANIIEKLNHGGLELDSEERNALIQQYKEKAIELNQSGEDYTILINPSDGKKVRANRDNRIQDLENQGYVAIEDEELVDIYRSFEFGRLEDHYNENAFALSSVDSKLNEQLLVSYTTAAGDAVQESVSLDKLDELLVFPKTKDFKILSDNNIEFDGKTTNTRTEDYDKLGDIVNLVNSMKEERFDLRKTQVALDRMYLLNESPLSIEKKGGETAAKSFIEGLGWWSERTTSLEGDFVTKRTVLDEIQNQMIELDFDITEREQNKFDRTFGETINEGGFGMSGLLLDFYLSNKLIFKPLKLATGVQKAQQIWNADRYARNGKIFSTALLQNRAAKANLTLAEYASKSRGFTNVGKSVQGQLLNTLVGTTEEALKFGMVMGDEKYMAEGGAFFLAGRILNPAFKLLKVNTPAQEQLYQRLIKGPAAFTTGSEGAQAFMNWGESLKGNVDYNNWVEDNFGDLDETLARCGEHWVLGTGLGFTHGGNMNFFRQMKYINANNTKKIANKSKLDAFNVIKEVYDASKQTPQFVVSPRLAKLINQTAGSNTITQEGLNLVKEFGSKKQNKKLDKNFKRFLEFENAHRQILNYQGYLNPGIAEKKVEQDNAAWIKEMRSKGEEVEIKAVQENEYVDSNFKVQKKKFGTSRFSDIEYRRQIFELTNEGYSKAQAEQMLNRLEQGQLGGKKAMWSPSVDGKRTIFYDVRQYEEGLLAHEVGHDWYNKELGQNVVLQEQFVKRLENIAMGIKMKSISQETGRQETLLEAINRTYPKASTNPSVRQQELFGHLAEMMSKPEIAREMSRYYGFSKIGNLINNVYPGSKKFNFSTDKGVFDWLNTYVETINKGKSPEGQFKHLEKFVDTELTQKAREAEFSSDMLESKDLNTKDKSRDLFLKDQQLFKETGEQSILLRADKYVRDQQGDLKYKTKEEFQRSEDFSEFFMELSKPEGMFDNIIRQEGRRAGVNEGEMSSYVERVKDNLIVSANRFNPAEAGGSIFGYFKNTAIPFEGLRIRTEFLEKIETGEKGKKVELDKEVGEGKARIEIEAENSFRETSFENENIGIEAQLRYREYLKEAGLNEAEAEAYMPTGKGIDVAKKLNIEAPEINIDNIDLTSYKNIRKTANEQTGDKVATEYFNIKPELWSIMKSTPAKNLNKPARKSIQEKIEADVQTIVKLLPQGAQNLISERGENITPEVLKNTSTGNKKVLLQIPMLYTKTSRTGKNLAEYVKTPELIKYEKLVDPKRGTPEFDFKQGFENRFLAEFGIGENAFKGRNLDQRLKAIVSETIGSIHNQSVRKVMNDLLMPKSLINQAAAGKSSALASARLEKLAGEKDGGDYITFLNEVRKESFSQLLGRNLRPPMNPEKGLAKALIEHFTNYKRSGLGEFNVSDSDLRQIAKEIHAQYKFGQITPAVIASKAVRAAESPNKLENIERQAGLEPSKFELNTPEDIVEARAVARVATKAVVEAYGDGVYEQVLMRGESGGKGVGAYPDFSSMMDGFGKSQNRFSSWESSAQAVEYHSDIKNSKGLKYTGPQKKLVEGQGNKKGQFTRLIDKKTGEWSTKALNEAYEVGEFNKDVLKTAVKALREAYEAGDITYSQARAWVEIHAGPMSGLIKLSGSFSVVPNMSVKQMFKRYGNNPSDYVLEHTTPAQYVKAKIYDYILNGTKAKKDAMDLTLADYHTTLIPKTLDVMVNKTLQSDLPSWHRPGMDPIASRYYEANHPSDFGFGLKNFKTGKVYDHHPNLNSSQKQKIQRQIKEANIKAFPKSLRKYAKTQLNSKNLEDAKAIDKALELGRLRKKKSRGGSFFDYDETLVDKGKNFIVATKGNQTVKISSGQWPLQGPKYAAEGWKFDFKDFVNVRGGVEGPLFKKFKERLNKFGPEHMYIVTARPAESAPAIHGWLKSKGVEIPLENITGLGNSTGEAKALYMLKKFSEGYNDMYFVDDALPNVKAVKDALNQLDIKSDVQQALASKNLNKGVNDIMEYSLDVKSAKVFSKAEAKVRGKDIKRRRFFIPDTAADLELLIEPMYGKGKQGTENKKWFQENFIRKWERGINDFNNARQAITNDYMSLRKKNKDVVKQLSEPVKGTNFTHDQAMRVYIWNKNGYTVPDLTPTTQQKLVKYVLNNPKYQAYAESLAKLTKVEGGLKEPSAEWWGETIATEIQDLGKGIGRKKYIQDFIDSKNEIFSETNLNKMESKLGTNWRETIEDMFDRMETGRTRSMNLGKTGNALMNYFNGSTGAIMNFNTRSAALQLISTVNFVNSSFNNPLMAAKAFANQPQYWKDFMTIMNSDMLKQRRAGLEINVTEAELASAASQSKSPAKAALAKILKAGYLPTKVADSFAIASGGATYYRNAINKYLKEGLSKAEAERKAFIDFQAIAERTQQSSRADLLSKQQTSFEGRLILAFANTPMQMNRIMTKDILDISKGRYKGFYGENSLTSKMSRIGYYGFVQSLIFAGLQSGAFALMTNSDDEKKIAESKLSMLNTVADSFLRGMGVQGAVVNGVRLAVQEFIKQDGKKYNADYSEVAEKLLNISPTVGSKFSKLDAAGNTYNYNKKVIQEEGLTLNGPLLEASTQVIEATTNVPLNRYYKKGNNIQNALDDSYYNWQRALSGMGWNVWGLGEGKDESRVRIKNKGKETEYTKYLTEEDLRREQVLKKVKEKRKQAKKANQQRCGGIKSDGTQCSIMVSKPKTRCHYHD